MGESSTGKTGSLTSLVSAGYKLRILDLDNGLDPLVAFCRKECPDKLINVHFEPVRDIYKAGSGNSGPIISGVPKAFTKSLELLTKWSDGTIPSEWGSDTVFIIDSLTSLSRAAMAWAESLNPMAKDPRQWYFTAQKAVENIIAMLTSESFKANVIIIAHVQIKELPDGTVKGYVNSVGSALGPIIPTYFNTIILAQSSGSGQNMKRNILTVSTSTIDLKNAAPFRIEGTLPLSTGVATIFAKLKETV